MPSASFRRLRPLASAVDEINVLKAEKTLKLPEARLTRELGTRKAGPAPMSQFYLSFFYIGGFIKGLADNSR